MAVNVGDIINSSDYNDLVDIVWSVMGDTYGQNFTLTKVTGSSTKDIDNAEWNTLKTLVDRASQHQTNANAGIGSQIEGRIVGADASGTSVTRVDSGGVVTFTQVSATANKGVNDYLNAVTDINTDKYTFSNSEMTETSDGTNGQTTRTTSWGGEGQPTGIDCQFDIEFPGGYEYIDSNGNTQTATGAQHAQHFFNAGGSINISGEGNGTNIKGSDWATMLSNMGAVKLERTRTITTGSGNPADGNHNSDELGGNDTIGYNTLNNSLQQIFWRGGGDVDSDYAENKIKIYAKKNATGDTVSFYLQLMDFDTGDQTGTGPPEDEPVQGTFSIKVDYRRATGSNVEVDAPYDADVSNELFQGSVT